MPKINASLADVSTKIELMEPDTYAFKIDEIQDKTTGRGSENEREAYQIVLTNDMPGTDHYGKKVWDYISLTTKAGGANQAGMAQLKRYFEAIEDREIPKEEPYDFDTDNLKGQRVAADIIIDNWEKDGKSGKSNKVKHILPISVMD